MTKRLQRTASGLQVLQAAAFGLTCFAAMTSTAQISQWPAADGGNDHWYQVIATPQGINWIDAQLAADAAGGYLVSLTTEEENLFVFGLADDPVFWAESGIRYRGPWLGGIQPEPGDLPPDAGWEWSNGETWDYTAWFGNEPNDFGQPENVICFWGTGTTTAAFWNDVASTDEAGPSYIIEYDSLPDGDGDDVVDIADNCIEIANADQRDTNADGYGNACDLDLNDDCVVNVVDLGILRSVFFSGDADADANGDGVVNVVDLGLMRSLFFQAPGPSGTTDSCD